MSDHRDERRERSALPPLAPSGARVSPAWLRRRAGHAARRGSMLVFGAGVAAAVVALALRSALRIVDGTTLILSAIALGAVAGYLVALGREMLHPRIADAAEAEAQSGLTALSVVRVEPRLPERSRRRSDARMPPYLDTASAAYRLAYLRIAELLPGGTALVVTGDDPTVCAVIATNIAAAAASDARNTLLIDADPEANVRAHGESRAVAGVLRIATEPGLSDVMEGRAAWAEAIIPVPVGRERVLDVLPGGTQRTPDAMKIDPAAARLDLIRLGRRYDMVVLVTSPARIVRGGEWVVPAGAPTVFCARLRETRIADLARSTDALKSGGTQLLGLIMWDDDAPQLDPPAPTDAFPTLTRVQRQLRLHC